MAFPLVLTAQPSRPSAARATSQGRPETPASLPIRRVALYKNGVGFFEHIGSVSGDGRVTIDFTTAQLNDVLQTLTAVDLGGGRIAGAGYNSTTPVEQQMRSLPLSLGADPTAADFYTAIRGARVEVTGLGAAVTGRILNVELRSTPSRKDNGEASPVVEHHFLTVISDAGTVHTFELNAKTSVRMLDVTLHNDVNRYLQILADNHKDGLRHLTLSDNGSGTREVRVSYISEVPVWKSTYRILFDNRAGTGPKQATLQGWAVVDNTVGADWNNVQLSLIAGAPQSFIQPISQPYYSRRPEIGLPQEAQLNPQTHEGGEPADALVSPSRVAGVVGAGMGSAGGAAGGIMGGVGVAAEQSAVPPVPMNGRNLRSQALAAPAAIAYEDSAAASIAARTTTTSGFDDFFEYKLTEPVTIAKNQSALVPILQTRVDVDPVTLFSANDRTALRALWIKNTSNLTLDRGSFSILESGNFSGQGLLEPIHPGERRLLSYATDTAVRVTRESPAGARANRSRRVQQITVSNGILTEKAGEVEEVEYQVHNAASESRAVIVEAPRLPGWDLDSELKPEETTPTVYRFRVVTAPNQTVRLRVGQRHTLYTRYGVATVDAGQIEALLKTDGNPPSVVAALRPVLTAKRHLAEVDRKIAANDSATNILINDQNRLRQNLAALKGSAEERSLVKRYTQELNTQEDTLNTLKTQLAALQTEQQTVREELNAAVTALQVSADMP